MIGDPLNDQRCLGPITELARRRVRQRDAALYEIACRFKSTTQAERWIRSLPQKDDDGDPADGPKVHACRPPQRLRPLSGSPNCFERTWMLIVLAEFIDPSVTRAMVTVDVPSGKHTFPVELVDGEWVPVVLDPSVPRNALYGGLFALDRRDVRVSAQHAAGWMAALAEEPADLDGNAHRVRNARSAMSDLLAGRSVSPRAVSDVAYVVGESRRQAAYFGHRGQTLHRQASGRLSAALVAQRRRNAILGLPLENLLGVPAGVIDSGVRATASFGHHQLRKLGLSKENADQLTDLGVAGLQLGIAALTGSFAGSIPAIAASAAMSGALNKTGGASAAAAPSAAPAAGTGSAAAPSAPTTSSAGGGSTALTPAGSASSPAVRNLGFLSFKTPGAALDEIEAADTEIRGLSADINDTFRAPFEAQLDKAKARFERERGYKPGIGAQSDPERDFAQVYQWMSPVPSQADIASKSYHGAFVEQFGVFSREWLAFAASHRGWTDRFWGSAWDGAHDYRLRAAKWREKFKQLGGEPTAPDPDLPEPSFPWGKVLTIAGIGAAVVLTPEVLRTIRARQSSSSSSSPPREPAGATP